MSGQFFIKKDPEARADNIEWISMNIEEFRAFRKSEEGKDRYFIEFDDLTIEATQSQYKTWRSEKDHGLYLLDEKKRRGMITVSLETVYQAERRADECAIPDEEADVETNTILKLEIDCLRNSMQTLDAESQRMIRELFLAAERKSEQELAKEFGITQQAVSWRKKKIFEKLKKSICKNQKKSTGIKCQAKKPRQAP